MDHLKKEIFILVVITLFVHPMFVLHLVVLVYKVVPTHVNVTDMNNIIIGILNMVLLNGKMGLYIMRLLLKKVIQHLMRQPMVNFIKQI